MSAWKSIQWKKLVACLALPLAVGALAGFLTRDSMSIYAQMPKPALSPPAWVFPVVWSILYVLMGLASYLVLVTPCVHLEQQRALRSYGWQLLLNFLWPLLFFGAQLCFVALLCLLLLLVSVFITAWRFYHIRPWAGYLLLPYILWLLFAAYLNLASCLLRL